MKELSLAIIAVMNDIEWVAKNMTVWSGNNQYKWVSDKDVRLAMRESMIKNWLSILPIWVQSKVQVDRWEEDDTYGKAAPYPKKSKQSIFTEVETKYLLLHTSGESVEVSWYGQGVDTQDKWAGKATTYALKNTLLNMFLVPTWVDTDNTHSDEYDIPKTKSAPKQNTSSLTPRGKSDTPACPQCGIVNKPEQKRTKEGRMYLLSKCECGHEYYVKDGWYEKQEINTAEEAGAPF